LLVRIFWRKLKGLWEKAKAGGAILARPREYAVKVVLPSFAAWIAKLGVIAVFLAAYGITVSFHSVMSVAGGNSIANTVSVTPGGVGVNQATNVAALSGTTDAATATAYSLGQQLAITAWNILFAIVVVTWAFGWSGGKALVEQSYEDAKVKVAEQKAERERRKAGRR
ncbi:MAG TPA: lysylphosphatidylglycerol synthase domain-containing protein, partial [Solirubrobacteraceae bacterium]|nr:lysylphosphatidylglycerol synthase domain-containing protein [Solirubrobacteraceae bacterium]